jgi:hypothetical protein
MAIDLVCPSQLCAILIWPSLLIAASLFVYLQTTLPFSPFWAYTASYTGIFLLVAFLDWLFARKLLVVDTQWTNDAQLDAELEGMREPGSLIWLWLVPFFRRRRQQIMQDFPNQAPRRFAYAMALWTSPHQRGTLIERVTREQLMGEGQDDAWQMLYDRLRAVLVEGQAPDAQTAALLLLATVPELHRFSRLPWEDATIYRLFAPEERQRAHERLTQLLQADPLMTTQLDPVLYDTLLFIRDKALEGIKRQPANTPGAQLSRVFTG